MGGHLRARFLTPNFEKLRLPRRWKGNSNLILFR